MDLTTVIDILYLAVVITFSFGILILFHEFGHFVVAKLSGVEAPEFAFGMGPELFGFNAGGTRYKLCAFPIGGYVKMVGEDEADPTETMNVPPEKNFQYKSAPTKIGIIFAGPFMNIVLGFILFTSIFLFWGVVRNVEADQASETVIVDFVDPWKPAGKAGFKYNDIILSADGEKITSSGGFIEHIKNNENKKVKVKILRGEKQLLLEVVPKYNLLIQRPTIGAHLRSPAPREIKSVKKNTPAWNAGLRKGDIILDFGGRDFQEEAYRFAGSVKLLRYEPEKPGPETVTVAAPAEGGEAGLGAVFYPIRTKPGVIKSVVFGAESSFTNMMFVGMVVKWLVTDREKRKLVVKEAAGPIGIIQYLISFFRTDIQTFLYFLGFISVNLALINLIPFPALDGSRIVIHLLEGIIRRPLDQHRVGIVHYIGFIVLISLIILISYRDVLRIIR